jgi:hypothetical protein
LGAAGLAYQENVEFGAEAETRPSFQIGTNGSLVTFGEATLKNSLSNNQFHSHYWEDANLAGIGSLYRTGLPAIAPVSYIQRVLSNPVSEITGFSWARGPPLLISA